MTTPHIGITVDNRLDPTVSRRYESPVAYSRAVVAAGGVPLLLPQEVSLAEAYVELCDGILLTGGNDPKMEAFGVTTHPQAKVTDPQRQAFEMAILNALAARRQKPALGICFGMQMMALHAGGTLNQHLPDTLGDAAEAHRKDHRHGVALLVKDTPLVDGTLPDDATVVSWHHQAVADGGRMRLIAKAPDGVVEAIDDAARPFYVGVQWHPERGGDGPLNAGLLRRFVRACLAARG